MTTQRTRAERLAEVKRRIEAGTYLDEQKLDIAADGAARDAMTSHERILHGWALIERLGKPDWRDQLTLPE